MKISKKYYSLPFDQFSRQSRAFDVIESLRVKDQSFKILDVGGYKGVTRELHVRDKVTVLDVFDVKESDYIKGSGLDLPFADESFDFVVSFDVFEHIEDKDRERFLAESSRVAKIAVITAAPVGTEANEQAESALNELYKSIHGVEHPWLKEHIDYGIPRPDQAKTILESLGLHTTVFSSNDVLLWTIMQGAIFLNSRYNDDINDLAKLNEFYNEQAYNDGTNDLLQSYRHIVCGFKSADSEAKAQDYLKKHSAVMSTQQKVSIMERVNQHYRVALASQANRYKKTEEEFLKKVEEKALLEKTIQNIEIERESYRRELEAIKSSKRYRLAHGLSKAKNAAKKARP